MLVLMAGPSVTLPKGSTNDTLVHCVDLFSTIIELARIGQSSMTELANKNVQLVSLFPVVNETDTTDRLIVSEMHEHNIGRNIITDG